MHFCTSAHEELPGGCVDQKRKQTRQGKLDMAVATIQRRYGPWSLVKGRPPRLAGDLAAVPHIPTGFSRLDQALGIGGLPLGRICELLGPATSGKTTLALKLLAHAQASGGQVAYIDQALYFDQDYAYRCGLDLSRLWVGKPYDLQEALAMAENLARSGGLAAAVLDLLDFLWTDPSASSLLLATLDRLPALLDRSGTTLLILHESWSVVPPPSRPWLIMPLFGSTWSASAGSTIMAISGVMRPGWKSPRTAWLRPGGRFASLSSSTARCMATACR
jgi:hypothetical protein